LLCRGAHGQVILAKVYKLLSETNGEPNLDMLELLRCDFSVLLESWWSSGYSAQHTSYETTDPGSNPRRSDFFPGRLQAL